MKSNIRNIGIFAHIDSGKTTFTERILYESGELESPGSVEEGTTEMDTLPEEIKRGISITASTTQIKYKYKKTTYYLNIIDTPGHLDFHSQVDTSLLAVDIAILMVDITTGIRSQTEMITKKILESNIPFIIFINKIDKQKNLESIINEINNLFNGRKVPVFKIYNEEITYLINREEIDEEIELQYIEWNSKLIDKYFSSKDSKKVIIEGLKDGFKERELYPIFAGSGLKGQGVRECIQFICGLDFKHGESEYDALVFKKQIHPLLGRIIYIKTFSPLNEGDVLYHGDVPYNISHLYTIIPGGVHENKNVPPYSIASFSCPKGLESEKWSVGDFLSRSPGTLKNIYEINNDNFFTREFIQILEPEKEEYRSELLRGIEDQVWEDPGLDFNINSDTGQYRLMGMGELHLEVSINRIESRIGNIFSKKNLFVAQYGLIKKGKKNFKWEHHTTDEKHFSYILETEIDFSDGFLNQVEFKTKISQPLKSSIESAFHEFLSHAVNGNPIVGLKLRILSINLPIKETDHSIALTKVAIIAGLKSFITDNWIKVGPSTFFEISLPTSQVGNIISLLQKREAKIFGMETPENNKTIIKGKASSESLLGFASSLRNLTQGKASVSMYTEFSPVNYSILST